MTTHKEKKRQQAEDYLKGDRYEEAVILLKEILEEDPEEEAALMMLAWAYYDHHDMAQALDCFYRLFERELRREIFTGFAYDELVRIYKQEKKYGELVEVCERAAAVYPTDISLLSELGRAYLQAGRAGDACAVCEKLIQMEDDNAALYCLWGEALFAAGRFAESEEAFRQAEKIDPEGEADCRFKLAMLFQQAQKHEEAVRLVKKCIEKNPDNPLYHCFLGDSLIGLKKIDEAVAAYDQAARCPTPIEESRAVYYHRLGNALMKARFFSDAVLSFRKALTLEDNPACWKGLLDAYRALGFDQEIQAITREREERQKS